jgi:transcriptional regulator with XRE-family HTH domain
MSTPRIKTESREYFRALGKHIALLRKARQLTQAELARAIGVSQQAVFAYELGERRVSILLLAKMSKVFGTSLEDLTELNRPVSGAKGRVSPRAVRHAERLQALPTSQQRFILRILDMLEDSNRGNAR